MDYHLRVDYERDEEKLKGFYEKFKDDVTELFGYHEISEKTKKPHFHIHIKYNNEQTEKDIRAKRIAYQRYWDRKGGAISLHADKGNSRVYTVKNKDRVFYVGILVEELMKYELASYVPSKGPDPSRKVKQKQESPMEKLLKAFNEQLEKDVHDYNYEHLVKKTKDDFVTDKYVVRFIMKWYGKHANKSFMIKKMAECANYLKYNVLYGEAFEQFVDNVGNRIELAMYE